MAERRRCQRASFEHPPDSIRKPLEEPASYGSFKPAAESEADSGAPEAARVRQLARGSPGFLAAVHKADSPLLHIAAAEAVAFAQRHLLPSRQQQQQPAVGGSAVDVEHELSWGTLPIGHPQEGEG